MIGTITGVVLGVVGTGGHDLVAGAMLAASWLDDAQRLAEGVETTFKIIGAAVAVVFIVVALAVNRTLGAVLSMLLVAGVALYGVNHTDDLQNKTEQTFVQASP